MLQYFVTFLPEAQKNYIHISLSYFIVCHHYMGKYLVKKSQNADKATKYLAGKKKAVQASLLSCTAEENVPRNFCFGGRGKERGYA